MVPSTQPAMDRMPITWGQGQGRGGGKGRDGEGGAGSEEWWEGREEW